ncbi:hypothetical protein K443DRAFT_679927 [Laccaria amethystina LaAM-08-1]|uniref:Uncharacterized protein n=1 Tax=Laccaria amethystina LaAM-08-1 TaxID=1095629 RepID=A0A0C9XPB1_9AGAR|nr:hypothetical protein K443DRAFT_679927 [Laccaria amethystina LaAM-08-1]
MGATIDRFPTTSRYLTPATEETGKRGRILPMESKPQRWVRQSMGMEGMRSLINL